MTKEKQERIREIRAAIKGISAQFDGLFGSELAIYKQFADSALETLKRVIDQYEKENNLKKQSL